ncbi:MAG: thiamine pyrophosphate-binding protein [Coriobacteriia bacterium]|nr:thiamine pyrophosphate-binding protein [Coriobacteriia bacterium]
MTKVSDYLARRVAELGVTHVFMVVGGGAMHLDDSFGGRDDLAYVCCHHEQACAIAVEGYARVRGAIGCAVVTTGPGGTNTITGVLGQWHDSVPALYLSGQVRYDTTVASTGLPLRQLGDQEADIVTIVSSITKYAVMVTDPQTIRYHFDRAVHLATSGRPGPVWLDIPLNVQAACIDPDALAPYDPAEDASVAGEGFDRDRVRAQIDEVVAHLKTAERPVVLAGSGIRTADAHDAFLALAERLGVPVATAWNAHDLLWEDHPLYAGRPSTIGDRAGNFAVQSSDLLIVLGCRMNIRQVGYNFDSFARAAYQVVVDIDPVELEKPTICPDLSVHSDVGFFIDTLMERLDGIDLPDRSWWVDWCLERRRRYPVCLSAYRERGEPVNPYVFVDTLSDHLVEGDVVITANGAACVVAFQALKLKRNQRLIGNSGTASMGYDVPASVGAAVARDGQRVVCLAGEGSIQMNLQEFETIAFNQFPVKVFVFENGGYLSIRQTQDNLFGGHYVGEAPRSGVGFPDMVRIAEAYGIPARRVASHVDLDETIAWALSLEGPVLVDVMMDSEQNFAPKSQAQKLPDGTLVSKPLEDLWPFLPAEEVRDNLLIPEWDGSR